MRHPKILVFSGSIRDGSYNGLLAGTIAKRLALADADVSLISLGDYPMPIYDGDLETSDGVPENARRLKQLMQRHAGIFIASPEYNTSISPLLKNTLDWVSRLSDPGEPSAAFKNRVFALGAASTGRLGGIRGLMGLRTILEIGLGALVIPEMSTVANAKTAFDEHGDLKDETAAKLADKTVRRLIAEARLRGE